MKQSWHFTEGLQGSSLCFLAQIVGKNGYVTQATLSSIQVKVFDLTDKQTAGTPKLDTALTIADVIYDTLQTEAALSENEKKWKLDDLGYNFLYELPASTFTKELRRRKYRVIFEFTPASGEAFILSFNEVVTQPADIDGL